MILLYAISIIPPVVGVRARYCTKYQKLVLKALQRWMPWPQEPIFLHLLEPESLQVAMRAISKNTNDAFSKGLCVYQNTNSSASKLWKPGPQESIFQHLLEPEAGPEGGNRKYK